MIDLCMFDQRRYVSMLYYSVPTGCLNIPVIPFEANNALQDYYKDQYIYMYIYSHIERERASNIGHAFIT